MGHPKPTILMQVENPTCDGIMNRKVQQIYEVIYRVEQKHFDMFWKPGLNNLGDYFTKNHSPVHQKRMIQYIYTILTVDRFLQWGDIQSAPQTGLKLNLFLQEAIIIHKNNHEYVPSPVGVKNNPRTSHYQLRNNKN